MTQRKEPKPETLSAIRRLSEMIDLVYFYGYVGRKSKFGKRMHPTDNWGYTRQMLREQDSPVAIEEIIAEFESVGAGDSEIAAAQWCIRNDKHIK